MGRESKWSAGPPGFLTCHLCHGTAVTCPQKAALRGVCSPVGPREMLRAGAWVRIRHRQVGRTIGSKAEIGTGAQEQAHELRGELSNGRPRSAESYASMPSQLRDVRVSSRARQEAQDSAAFRV